MKEIQAKRQGFSWQDIDNPFAQTGSRWTRWTQRPGWGEMWFPATCFFKCKLLSGLSRTYDDPSCFFSLRLQRNTTIGREWNNPRAGCFRPSNPKLESPLQHSIIHTSEFPAFCSTSDASHFLAPSTKNQTLTLAQLGQAWFSRQLSNHVVSACFWCYCCCKETSRDSTVRRQFELVGSFRE